MKLSLTWQSKPTTKWQNHFLSNYCLRLMCSVKSSWVNFSIEVSSTNSLFAEFFWPSLLVKGFSLRILMLCWMELDLPTPVSPYTSHCTCPPSHATYLPSKIQMQVYIICKFRQNHFKNKNKNQRGREREKVWLAHFWQQWVCCTWNLTFLQVLWTWYPQS